MHEDPFEDPSIYRSILQRAKKNMMKKNNVCKLVGLLGSFRECLDNYLSIWKRDLQWFLTLEPKLTTFSTNRKKRWRSYSIKAFHTQNPVTVFWYRSSFFSFFFVLSLIDYVLLELILVVLCFFLKKEDFIRSTMFTLKMISTISVSYILDLRSFAMLQINRRSRIEWHYRVSVNLTKFNDISVIVLAFDMIRRIFFCCFSDASLQLGIPSCSL